MLRSGDLVRDALTLPHGKTLAAVQRQRGIVYYVLVCGEQPSVALTLLACWDAPWSSAAKRYAYHTLHRAMASGIDVLES